jgi:hypothetical protein
MLKSEGGNPIPCANVVKTLTGGALPNISGTAQEGAHTDLPIFSMSDSTVVM